MKALFVLLTASVLSSAAFANPSDSECYAKTYKGETITLDFGFQTDNSDDAVEGSGKQWIIVSLGDKDITRYENDNLVDSMKNFGSEKDPFMLNTTEGTNSRGKISIYWPEQLPDEANTYVIVSLKVQRLDKTGYVFNFKDLEFTCPNH